MFGGAEAWRSDGVNRSPCAAGRRQVSGRLRLACSDADRAFGTPKPAAIPTIGASRTSSGSCPPEATNSCPVGGVQLIHHRSSATSTCRVDLPTWPADLSQRLLAYTAEPGSPRERPPRLLARWAATTDGFGPAASTDPRRRLNRSGGPLGMGNNLKRPALVFQTAGEACPPGRSRLRDQYLDRWLHKLRVTAHADSAIRDGNVR